MKGEVWGKGGMGGGGGERVKQLKRKQGARNASLERKAGVIGDSIYHLSNVKVMKLSVKTAIPEASYLYRDFLFFFNPMLRSGGS